MWGLVSFKRGECPNLCSYSKHEAVSSCPLFLAALCSPNVCACVHIAPGLLVPSWALSCRLWISDFQPFHPIECPLFPLYGDQMTPGFSLQSGSYCMETNKRFISISLPCNTCSKELDSNIFCAHLCLHHVVLCIMLLHSGLLFVAPSRSPRELTQEWPGKCNLERSSEDVVGPAHLNG